MSNQNNYAAISDADLDKVSGGWGGLVARMASSKGGSTTGGTGGSSDGGQNDPKQMFQQIMNQLTQQ